MRTMKQMVDALLGEKRRPEEPSIIRMGVVHTKTGRAVLCSPDAQLRGVKLVTVTRDLAARYNRVIDDDILVQAELHALSKSLRPRKRKLKIIPLPPNPEPSAVMTDAVILEVAG